MTNFCADNVRVQKSGCILRRRVKNERISAEDENNTEESNKREDSKKGDEKEENKDKNLGREPKSDHSGKKNPKEDLWQKKRGNICIVIVQSEKKKSIFEELE